MFKSSENLRLAAEMRALTRVASPWREARTTWFDGTPESIESRLAATDRVLTVARAGCTGEHMALEREAATARAELADARHRLMTDFLDDGARAFKGSRRTAGLHDSDPEAPWRNTMADEPYASLSETPDFGDLPLDGDYQGEHRLPEEAEGAPLGPGYDRPGFGPDDIAEYEDHLDHHDYLNEAHDAGRGIDGRPLASRQASITDFADELLY